MTRASLASYCETWSVFVDATKTIHAEGILAEGRSGQVVHPAVKVQMQASAELRRWAVEYALNPGLRLLQVVGCGARGPLGRRGHLGEGEPESWGVDRPGVPAVGGSPGPPAARPPQRLRPLYLNRWTQQATRWLSLDSWDASAGLVVETKLHGRACYAGLDLASTQDLTALALDFPDDDGGHQVIWRFWLPEERLQDLDRRTAGQASVWVRQGLLQLTWEVSWTTTRSWRSWTATPLPLTCGKLHMTGGGPRSWCRTSRRPA